MQKEELIELLRNNQKYELAKKRLLEMGIQLNLYSHTCGKDVLGLRMVIARKIRTDLGISKDEAINISSIFIEKWIKKG